MIPYERQRKILEYANAHDLVLLEDLLDLIPDASESTLRRDIKALEEAQGKSDRQSFMVVASRLNNLDLKRNLCFEAFAAHRPYISANRSLKKSAGRELFASAKVERATFFSPQ